MAIEERVEVVGVRRRKKGWHEAKERSSCGGMLVEVQRTEKKAKKRYYLWDGGYVVKESKRGRDGGGEGIGASVGRFSGLKLGLLTWVLRTFYLPVGFPESVPSCYGEFVRWNIMRHIFLNALSVLGTQHMLLSLGVNKGRLSISSIWNWVLKDGVGLGSKVLIASGISAKVDRDPKRWRLFGDLVQISGTLLELSTALCPKYFFLFAACGNLVKKCADAATNPSYRVILNSFALSSNIGDISSRGESQVVTGKLLGLLLGVGISAITDNFRMLTYAMCFLLVILFLFCSYRSTASIHLATLDWDRLQYVAEEFYRHGSVPSVAEANDHQRGRLLSPGLGSVGRRIRVGTELGDYTKSAEEVTMLLSFFCEEKYMMKMSNGKCGIMLRKDATALDILCAAIEATILVRRSQNLHAEDVSKVSVMAEVRAWMREQDGLLRRRLVAQGWETNRLVLEVGPTRFSIRKVSPTTVTNI
mmetsp:Transcript_7421/g.22583  ORF Transcript_7421/g.22583 Transcript_7421/m.22583 type:complete len:474 (+) Transcript_7421:38-1459(+)